MKITNALIPTWAKWLAGVLVLAALAGAVGYTVHTYNSILQSRFDAGYKAGYAACETLQTQAQSKAKDNVIDGAKTDLANAAAQGAAHEQRRAGVDSTFDQLDHDLRKAQGDHRADLQSLDCSHYVLPAERLRIWQAGNRGSASGAAHPASAATSQPAGRTAPLAPASQRPPARAGDQPPSGGEAIPPAGHTALRPAAAPKSAASGVQTVDVFRGN